MSGLDKEQRGDLIINLLSRFPEAFMDAMATTQPEPPIPFDDPSIPFAHFLVCFRASGEGLSTMFVINMNGFSQRALEDNPDVSMEILSNEKSGSCHGHHRTRPFVKLVMDKKFLNTLVKFVNFR